MLLDGRRHDHIEVGFLYALGPYANSAHPEGFELMEEACPDLNPGDTDL